MKLNVDSATLPSKWASVCFAQSHPMMLLTGRFVLRGETIKFERYWNSDAIVWSKPLWCHEIHALFRKICTSPFLRWPLEISVTHVRQLHYMTLLVGKNLTEKGRTPNTSESRGCLVSVCQTLPAGWSFYFWSYCHGFGLVYFFFWPSPNVA